MPDEEARGPTPPAPEGVEALPEPTEAERIVRAVVLGALLGLALSLLGRRR